MGRGEGGGAVEWSSGYESAVRANKCVGSVKKKLIDSGVWVGVER